MLRKSTSQPVTSRSTTSRGRFRCKRPPAKARTAKVIGFLALFCEACFLLHGLDSRRWPPCQFGSHGNQAAATPVPTAGDDAPAAAGHPLVAAFAPRAD